MKTKNKIVITVTSALILACWIGNAQAETTVKYNGGKRVVVPCKSDSCGGPKP